MASMKDIRYFKKMTLAKLSTKTGINISKLSLIQNEQVIPTDKEKTKIENALDAVGFIDWEVTDNG